MYCSNNKQDSNPDFNPLHDALWGVLINKTNANAYPDIGSFKTANEKE